MVGLALKQMCIATLLAAAAHAQFTASSGAALGFTTTPRTLRAEGQAEVAGDIVIQSANPGAMIATGAQGASATVTLFFNTNVNNKVNVSTAGLSNSNGTIAGSGIQVTLSNFTFSSGTTSFTWNAEVNFLTITIQMAPNSFLVFGSGETPASIAVTGVRVNPNVLGVLTSAVYCAMNAGAPLSNSGPTVLLAGNLAYTLIGNGGASSSSASLERRAEAATTATGQINLTVVEGFPGALTTLAQETALSGTEVTNGTQFELFIENFTPSTFTTQVYQVLQNPQLTLTLVSNGVPLAGATPGATSGVTFSSGVASTGTAIVAYEVTAARPNAGVSSAIQVPLLLAADPGGTITPFTVILFSVGPVSASGIPRFASNISPQTVGALLLSQQDFLFTAPLGSTTVQQQGLQVLGIGVGGFAWTAQASIPAGTAGGQAWLSVDQTSGATGLDPSTTTPLNVLVNPTGLPAGDYYGLVAVASPKVANSPQYATVHLRILPATAPPQANVSPGGLLVTAPAGGPAALQQIVLGNVGASPLVYTAKASGGAWLAATPASGSVPMAGSASITAAVNPAGLAPGSYSGAITFSFADGTTRVVNVLLVVGPSSSVGAAALRAPGAAVCTPATLNAVSTSLTNQFQTPVGWGSDIVVSVVDNCLNPILSAVVLAITPDGPLTFASLNNGLYVVRWTPQSAQTQQVKISVSDPPLPSISFTLNGQSSGNNPNSPQMSAPVNGASFAPGAAVAPGSIVSVFGVNLLSPALSGALPLPTSLGGLSVTVGGVSTPLFYAGPGQVNAQLPLELAGETSTSMVVALNGNLSSPQPVVLTPLQPGVFYYLQGSVTRGAILDAQNRPIDSSNPATAASVIQVFATGFGPTSPQVATGAVGPSNPPAVVSASRIEAIIGSSTAAVQFAGLAPGLVGLYQFNLTVPSGLGVGDVPVQISANGILSNTVMLAVK
jgi:uncharacterized protein (TIGR03437 family)